MPLSQPPLRCREPRGQIDGTMTRQPFNPNLIQAPAGERPGAAGGPLTVSQVTALVKQAIESALPSTIHVVGEISNFKRHSSGHLYFTLKDRFSELGCVMWRSAAATLKFKPADGLEVIATGTVEVFERTGRYQLYVRRIEPRGVGALELAFRQLCEKLSKEGLFDERHKQPLPAYPERMVLVTSPTGAAVADMLRTIERRFPCVQVFVFPVRVQGPGAASEIAAAIRRVNANSTALGGVDVMIVGRGGGSLEDLWPFNEEVVARAIHASRIPIISAVGHEVDVTIADLVADVRAATPTAAAELAVPVLEEVLAGLAAHESRLSRAVRAKIDILATRY
ncbi:MAG: exodeoxyribonuclease VII large subunit, partial [Phycisphaerae bacterium]